MLTVSNAGKLNDKLHLVSQRVAAISNSQKEQTLSQLKRDGDLDQIIRMLRHSRNFELKFDKITPTKVEQYKELIRIFLSDNSNRFVAMVIDKKEVGYNDNFFSTTWDAYTSYVATLVTHELVNLPNEEMFLVLDELPKPKAQKDSLEEIIVEKVDRQCKRKHSDKKLCALKNCIRIESHSNLLMQLCDVLLGAVMFDFKKNAGVLSEQLQIKKDPVVDILRTSLGRQSLDLPFTVNRPVYFNVWRPIWKQE